MHNAPSLTDYQLGYDHGYNDNRSRPGVKKYPNNTDYIIGFVEGDWARVHQPARQEPGKAIDDGYTDWTMRQGEMGNYSRA